MSNDVREATGDDLSQAAYTLSAAFEYYPWTRWVISEEDYSSRLLQLQTIYLSHAMEHGLVLVTEHLDGVAAMIPPCAPDPSAAVQARIVDLMGDRAEIAFSAQLPPRLHESWDFATIGVQPKRAGNGLGSSLIKNALARAASSAYPRISLETSALSNVSLYQRHGFATSHRTEIPDGPVVYTMGVEL